MISRARIAQLSKDSSTLRVPYGGDLRALAELKALDVAVTPEDYTAIRLSLGGGKRGRLRARELVPVQCPSCDCRLTHFERSGRPPYFAATDGESPHGPQCEAVAACFGALGPPGGEEAAAGYEEVALEELEELQPAPHYMIDDVSFPTSGGAVSAQRPLSSDAEVEPAPRGLRLADSRELLILALNRAVPAHSTVCFRGQNYAVHAAAEVHHLHDGEHVAVYGRLSAATWNQESGRLTLRAVPHTVQVWATAGVPRALLRLTLGLPVEAPFLPRPVPFLVFGRLKKLGTVCGIPVVRSDSLTLLEPLPQAARAEPCASSSMPPVGASSPDELTGHASPVSDSEAPAQGPTRHPFDQPDPDDDALLDELLASMPELAAPVLAAATATAGKAVRLKRVQSKQKIVGRGAREKSRRASR